jgi:hypothetical protein
VVLLDREENFRTRDSSPRQQQQENPMVAFMYGIKSLETKRQYPRRLKMFLDFLEFDGVSTIEEQAKIFLSLARANNQWAEEGFMRFVGFQLERVNAGKIAACTVSNYYKATKLFCEMNNLVLNWRRLRKGLPRGREVANDRAPTTDEVQKLIEFPDRRIKPIVYTMISSGFRIGAWDYLKWKHVKPIENKNGEIIAARLTVYAGDSEEYYPLSPPRPTVH